MGKAECLRGQAKGRRICAVRGEMGLCYRGTEVRSDSGSEACDLALVPIGYMTLGQLLISLSLSFLLSTVGIIFADFCC